MELKLDQRAQVFLHDVGRLTGDVYHNPASDNCLDHKIDLLFAEWEKELEGKSNFFWWNFKFLKGVAAVQQDGRSCPGEERKAELWKLTNDQWRKDHRIIMSGIACFVITLDKIDAIKLA